MLLFSFWGQNDKQQLSTGEKVYVMVIGKKWSALSTPNLAAPTSTNFRYRLSRLWLHHYFRLLTKLCSNPTHNISLQGTDDVAAMPPSILVLKNHECLSCPSALSPHPSCQKNLLMLQKVLDKYIMSSTLIKSMFIGLSMYSLCSKI